MGLKVNKSQFCCLISYKSLYALHYSDQLIKLSNFSFCSKATNLRIILSKIMRSSSIFHDEKLLLSLPNTLETSPNLTLSRINLPPKPLNFPRLFVACSTLPYLLPLQGVYCVTRANTNLKKYCNNFSNFALPFQLKHQFKQGLLQTRGLSDTINKSKEMSRVSLIFTSLEVENLYSAFDLFLVFLSHYIDKLLKSKFLKLTSALPIVALPTLLPLQGGKPIGDWVLTSSVTLPYLCKNVTRSRQEHHIFSKVALSTSRYGEDYKLRNLALKTVRNLAQPLLALGVPQKANLYTVIRSPHVFKKTREQFVKQKYKLRIQLDFASNTLSSKFLDALVLLKLPAEIKVVIHSRL